MKKHLVIAATTAFALAVSQTVAISSVNEESGMIPRGEIEKRLLPVAYSGKEKLKFAVSWTGGVKLGELHLEIRKVQQQPDDYELRAHVTTEGVFFDSIYPVRDVYVTKVKGEKRLPYSYEVWQKEGYNYQAHRKTRYDQNKGVITYRKNYGEETEFPIEGESHNEFSAFFSSRLMDLAEGSSFTVPTFADKKRVDVLVQVTGKRFMGDTAIGPVETVEVSPILNFRGLYDKSGDTTIWYTDDECRVPVKVTSKIMIGSVTATLMDYQNPDCPKYTAISSK